DCRVACERIAPAASTAGAHDKGVARFQRQRIELGWDLLDGAVAALDVGVIRRRGASPVKSPGLRAVPFIDEEELGGSQGADRSHQAMATPVHARTGATGTERILLDTDGVDRLHEFGRRVLEPGVPGER